MLLLLDNYDSFVYNLARYFECLGQQTLVVRNDAIDVDAIRQLAPQAIVLSPGPCAPQDAGVSLEVVEHLHAEYPMLGVCLGHQAIAAALGSKVVRANRPVHGQTSEIEHHGINLFDRLPSPMKVCRYHSLVVDPDSLPSSISVTAWTRTGTVMAIEHRDLPLFGVQFHPEAILTESGYPLLANFLHHAHCPIPGTIPASTGTELREKVKPGRLLPRTPVTF